VTNLNFSIRNNEQTFENIKSQHKKITKMNNKNSVFNTFGLEYYQEIIYLSLAPIGLIGIGLNILTFVILRGEQFSLPVIHYLRAHTINSCFMCLIMPTVITGHINSEWSARYRAHFYIPFVNLLFFYQTSLDIVLTLDRALTFTTHFENLRHFKPKLVSIILLVISVLMSLPSWFTFGTKQIEIQLNGTERVTFHSSSMEPNHFFYINNLIFNVTPFVIEMPLNIITMIFLKKYLKRRVHFRNARPANHPDGFLLQQENRLRKMEMKVTLLVVILSVLSFM
jgi:hypothetical protein